MKKRATELAKKIQNENGIQNAIRFFNKHVGEQLQDIQSFFFFFPFSKRFEFKITLIFLSKKIENNPCKFKDEEFGFVCVDYED